MCDEHNTSGPSGTGPDSADGHAAPTPLHVATGGGATAQFNREYFWTIWRTPIVGEVQHHLGHALRER